MFYCYLSDEAFAVTGTESVMSYDDLKTYNLGMLDDNLLNYLNTSTPKNPKNSHQIISDAVYSIVRDDRRHYDLTTPNSHPYGKMYLHFDENKIIPGDVENKFIESITINSSDNEDARDVKRKRRAYLFDIVEACFYAHQSSNSEPYSQSELDAKLQEIANIRPNIAPYNDHFYYIEGSVKISNTTTQAKYRYWNSNSESIDVLTESIHFYDSVEFQFRFKKATSGSLDTDSIVTIKVWLNSEHFKAEYPYSTIVNCIYPCKASWLLHPTQSEGTIQAVINAATYKDNALDIAVTGYDHTGVTLYRTRYTHSAVGSTVTRVAFVIMYKGAIPTAQQMRDFVREQLLNEGIATEDEWSTILPDLFVDASFYIVPCFYLRIKQGTRYIERNVANFRLMMDKLRLLFPNEDLDALYDYTEILQAPGHDIYLLSYPVDPEIDPVYRSLTSIHPTYQAVDSVGRAFHYVLTTDSKYAVNKAYFTYDNTNRAYVRLYENSAEHPEGYTVGADIVMTNNPPYYVFEKVAIQDAQWDTMTDPTQMFAQTISNCVAACIDPENEHASEFTEEEIHTSDTTNRLFYQFVVNHIEYHVLTIQGAEGIFDSNEETEE